MRTDRRIGRRTDRLMDEEDCVYIDFFFQISPFISLPRRLDRREMAQRGAGSASCEVVDALRMDGHEDPFRSGAPAADRGDETTVTEQSYKKKFS